MKTDITYLGLVINVDSSSIEIEVSDDIPSSAPIINGRLYRIGQIGTLIKIPVGNINLFGIVASVSNLPNKLVDSNNDLLPSRGSRYLQVQLVGEQIGNMKFERGLGTFPTINDEAHIVTEEDLREIYGNKTHGLIEVGKHSSSENLSVYLDLPNLVLRHCAVLGSTGSGKSNTIAHILNEILSSYTGSRMVLIDIHGEYSTAFKGKCKTFKINDKDNPLFVPYWTLNFDELSFFLAGRPNGQERPEDKRLREEILKYKIISANKLKAGNVQESFITADSPIPFDIKLMWHTLNREVHGTFSKAGIQEQNRDNEEIEDEGEYKNLIPAKFKPYSLGSSAPFKSKNEMMYAYEQKIYSRLKDSRYNFMFNPAEYCDTNSSNDLDELIRSWVEHDERLTILDLSEVPFELIDITVGIVTRLIYDSMYWGKNEVYTGRNRPLLMIYEEAHSYLPRNEGTHIYGYARKAVEKIFKEGRKFGLGAMVVTQRPSEISETILAQVGTFIALRLTNSSDKNTVKSAAPNNMTSLIDLLSSLRKGEAIVVGEAIEIPSRVRIKEYVPRPNSNDPDLTQKWNQDFECNAENYKKVITAMREQKHI
ncbi:ATP-binding protein [Paenibacillus odorifer]|uniref:ATP-binding protein n=1 Tax=Paenibacillus odorifer TaxID=189426 RepID=UPI00096C3F5F|nr:ATP-binding protein [Paenibacillus odorifer]OMD78146.1 AAA family ATPase [Paenibacillus odorifer]